MQIRNWKKFQHFKNRRPPWIKLYREEILNRRDINMISDRSFRVFILLLLLASEDEGLEGRLPNIDEIVFRLRLPKDDILKALQDLEPFVYQDDINVTSIRYQDGPSEESRGREETKKSKRHTNTRFIPPTAEEINTYTAEKKINVDAQNFIDFYESKGWMVGKNKMKNWKAAVSRAKNWGENSLEADEANASMNALFS